MDKILATLFFIFLLTMLWTCNRNGDSGIRLNIDNKKIKVKEEDMPVKVKKTDDEWQKELTLEQYRILRKKGTELPFSGKYNDFKDEGIYKCAGCGNPLFSSDTKYNSGSGWPSFWAPYSNENIDLKVDKNLFMTRTEVLCKRCGGHLGHVFDDGPQPTNRRYCINSAALEFETKDQESDQQ